MLDKLPVANILNLKTELMIQNSANLPKKEIRLSLYLQAKIKQYETNNLDVGSLGENEEVTLTIDELNNIHCHRDLLDNKSYCKLKVTAIAGSSVTRVHARSLLEDVSKKSKPSSYDNPDYNPDGDDH